MDRNLGASRVIGGGFPVACFGGTKEVMEIEAKNEVMHGGTYTASPLALAAADAVLKRIERDKDTMYPRLFELSERLRDGLVRVIRDAGFHCFGQGIGPLFQVFIGNSDIDRLYNYRDTVGYVREDIFSAFHAEMQKRGIYCHPGQFERWFLSTEHTDQDIDDTIAAADESIRAVAKKF